MSETFSPLTTSINPINSLFRYYDLYVSADIRDGFIYMNTTKTIPVGKFIRFSFAYRNFNDQQ